jgi:hypothetical protein
MNPESIPLIRKYSYSSHTGLIFKLKPVSSTPLLRVKNHLAGLVSRQSLGLGHGEEEEEDGEVSETEAEDSDLDTDPDDEYIEVSQQTEKNNGYVVNKCVPTNKLGNRERGGGELLLLAPLQ